MNVNTINWSPGVTLENVEKQTILAAFRHFRGNKTQTAISLGIAIRTLDNKLEQYQAEDTKKEKSKDERDARSRSFLERQRGFTTSSDGSVQVIEGAKRNVAPERDVVSGETRETAERAPNGSDAEAGLRMEPVAESVSEQPVPLPLGKEVQSMSPKHAAGNRHGKRR